MTDKQQQGKPQAQGREWTIEQIRDFVKKDFQSVSARMTNCLLKYYDEKTSPSSIPTEVQKEENKSVDELAKDKYPTISMNYCTGPIDYQNKNSVQNEFREAFKAGFLAASPKGKEEDAVEFLKWGIDVHCPYEMQVDDLLCIEYWVNKENNKDVLTTEELFEKFKRSKGTTG